MTTLHELGIRPDRCRVVVEAGACNGHLGWALDAVNAAADTGIVWGFKAQLYNRERLTTRTAPTYGHDIDEPDRQWEHFNRQLSWSDWAKVKAECDRRGLVFFASVFDTDAIDWCETNNVPLYKIASADITHRPLLEQVAATGKPIVLSTGGATLGEIQRAYEWVRNIDPDVQVLPLICTLSYPTPADQAHLARIGWWQNNIDAMVGYSDHTEGISAMLTARTLGAVMIEKHFTITPGTGGDHDFAVTPELLDLYRVCPDTIPGPYHTAETGQQQIEPRRIEHDAVTYARRSIAAANDIPAGNIIRLDDLTYLRPGIGPYAPWQTSEVVNQAAPVDIPAGTLIPHLSSSQPGTIGGRGRISASLTVE